MLSNHNRIHNRGWKSWTSLMYFCLTIIWDFLRNFQTLWWGEILQPLFFLLAVPTDGVKGKTWGPSSGGHVLSSLGNNAGGQPKSRPSIPEERWSKSASNLEKSPKTKPGIPSVTSVPEMGKFSYHWGEFIGNDVNFAFVVFEDIFLIFSHLLPSFLMLTNQ